MIRLDRLRTAAPDLYDALNDLLDHVYSHHGCINAHGMPITNSDHPWHDVVMRARAALAKAERARHES